MIISGKQVSLPRRAAACFLLFGIVAIVWLGFGVYQTSETIILERSESHSLSTLGKVINVLSLDYLRNGDKQYPVLVKKLLEKHNLSYLAVVGPDGKFTAHTSSELIGTKATEPAGAIDAWGDTSRIRFVNLDSQVIQEFRSPLRPGGNIVGTVRLAILEPSIWQSFCDATQQAPAVVGIPLILLIIGSGVINRMTKPVAEIEQQLRGVASAPSVIGCDLFEVSSSGPAALGWNRLIDERNNQSDSGSLTNKLKGSLGSLRADKFDRILKELSEGIATTDQEGRITYANPVFDAILYQDPEPITTAEKTTASSSSKKTPSKRILEVLKGCCDLPDNSPLNDPNSWQRPIVIELEGKLANERRVLRVSRMPFQSSGAEQSTEYLWSIRDITQQKLVEETRNQFVDTATHELRTPLANIKAYAETLSMSDMMDMEEQKVFLNTINTEATRLARFVDELLSVSSMEVGSLTISKKNVDMKRLFSEVVEKVKPLAKEKQQIFEAQLPEKFPEISADKDKISALLVNLIGNAVKYTPVHGSIQLRVEIVDSGMEITVEDSGFGITEDDIPKLFDKFYRSNDPRIRAESGTGLGLSLAQEVVRLHGGEITVESALDQGTQFIFTLPLS